MEDRILASFGGSGPIPVNAGAWQSSSGTYLAGDARRGIEDRHALASMTASLTDRQVTEAILAGWRRAACGRRLGLPACVVRP